MDSQNGKVHSSSDQASIGNFFSSTFFLTFLGEYFVVVFGLIHAFANGSNPLFFFLKFMSMILLWWRMMHMVVKLEKFPIWLVCRFVNAREKTNIYPFISFMEFSIS